MWTRNTDEKVHMLGEDSKFNIRHISFEAPKGYLMTMARKQNLLRREIW